MNGVSLKKQRSKSPNANNAVKTNVKHFLNGTARCCIQCIQYETKVMKMKNSLGDCMAKEAVGIYAVAKTKAGGIAQSMSDILSWD
jgi:hypothetical protein